MKPSRLRLIVPVIAILCSTFAVPPLRAETFQARIGRLFTDVSGGRIEEAVEEELTKDPGRVEVWLELAADRKSRGDLAGAVPAYEKALALRDDWKVDTALALALEQLGRFPEAENRLEALDSRHPDDPEVLWGLAASGSSRPAGKA